MNVFKICKGCVLPHLEATLEQSGGVLPGLAAAVVTFTMVPNAGGTPITGTCVVDNAATGAVHYAWSIGETDTIGKYRGQFTVTYGSGETLPVPTDGAVLVEIVPKVEDAGAIEWV